MFQTIDILLDADRPALKYLLALNVQYVGLIIKLNEIARIIHLFEILEVRSKNTIKFRP